MGRFADIFYSIFGHPFVPRSAFQHTTADLVSFIEDQIHQYRLEYQANAQQDRSKVNSKVEDTLCSRLLSLLQEVRTQRLNMPIKSFHSVVRRNITTYLTTDNLWLGDARLSKLH